MCLIVFDWRPDGAGTDRRPLFTLAANRDEFLHRAADPLHWWRDTPRTPSGLIREGWRNGGTPRTPGAPRTPNLIAGRDLAGGGTWLGLTRDGRFAALTNYRAPHAMRADAPTRGTLVLAWLSGEPRKLGAPLDYLREVARHGAAYNGFNLLVGDWFRRELAWYCNRADAPPALLPAGTHGVSNAALDTPWPKLARKRAELARRISGDAFAPLDTLIDMMRDPQPAPDDALPSTGIPLARERALSAAFIDLPDYGTRGTTALRITATGAKSEGQLSAHIIERSDDDGSHRIVRPGHFERCARFRMRRPADDS